MNIDLSLILPKELIFYIKVFVGILSGQLWEIYLKKNNYPIINLRTDLSLLSAYRKVTKYHDKAIILFNEIPQNNVISCYFDDIVEINGKLTNKIILLQALEKNILHFLMLQNVTYQPFRFCIYNCIYKHTPI